MKRARGGAVALAVLLFAKAGEAAPPDMQTCISAFDKGQKSRSDRALRRAQTELLVCTQEACPAVLRADCAGVLASVQAEIPTIVLAADDGQGHDITDVKVYSGSDLLAPRIDGRALEQDPGAYTFRFVRSSGKSLELPVTIRVGEKNRVVRASFPVPGPPSARRDAKPPPERSTIGWVVPSGLALGAVVGFAIAGISRVRFDSQVSDYRSANGCAPECTQSQRDDLSKTLVTANVALGAGIGLLAGAVISWIILAPTSQRTTGAAALSW
jgi:hypothetical protein